MNTFKKIILIFLLSSFLLLLFGGFCFAQRKLEIIYPAVPGVQTPMTTKTALPDYLRYVFTFAITISGLVAFGAMIYGGFLYVTSAGDPTKISGGKDQVMAGILGLIIVLSSFLILNTINPQLVLPAAPPMTPTEGGIRIYSMNGCQENETHPPMRVTQNIRKLGNPGLALDWGTDGAYKIESIKFLSKPGDLTVNLWSENWSKEESFHGTKNPVDYPTGDTEPCKDFDGSTPHRSIELIWHMPGVYLYATENCTGDKYGTDYVIYQGSSATLQDFDNKTQSIKFLYGEKVDGEYRLKFAAILHEKENYMGEALLFDQNQNVCKRLSEKLYPTPVDLMNKVSSLTVYLKPIDLPTAGGVRFWKDKNYTGEYLAADANQDGYYGDNENESNLNTDLRVISPPSSAAAGFSCEPLGGIANNYQCTGTPPPQCVPLGDCTHYQCRNMAHGDTARFGEDPYYWYCCNVSESISVGECQLTQIENPIDLLNPPPSPIPLAGVPHIEHFDNVVTAMEMDGHYIALLFRDADFKDDCEVFTEPKPDFRPFRIGQCGWLGRSDCLSSFIIKARR